MPQNLATYIAQIVNTSTLAYNLLGKQRDMLTSLLHGSKYTQSYLGNIFVAANPSGVTTSAGLATTYVGLCLSNPAASPVNLAIRRVSGAFIVAPATVTGFNLITGWSAAGVVTHTTPLTPFAAKIGLGGATPVVPNGLVDSAATIVGTPVYTTPLSETSTATTLPFFTVDLEGAIILTPGSYAAIGTTIAGPASGFQGAFEWEEIAP